MTEPSSHDVSSPITTHRSRLGPVTHFLEKKITSPLATRLVPVTGREEFSRDREKFARPR